MDRLVAQLTEAREELNEAVESVPADIRTVQPGHSRWSVAEILEHCAIVEGEVDRLLTGMVEKVGGARVVAGQEEEPSLPVDLSQVLDRSQRFQAPEHMRPSGTLHWLEALQRLKAARTGLLRTIASARHFPLNATAPHFLLGELNGYEWIEFVGRHEQRHADQVREVGSAFRLQDPASP